jgi:serine acetyltransferase
MTSSRGDEASFGVVIPAYNATKTLRGTILSAQNAGASTVIVVDDGSTDGTAQLAREMGCTVLVQVNSGAAAARRVGIAAILEPFTVLLDADDELLADGVHESVRLLLDAKNAVAAQGKTIGIGHDGAEQALRGWPGGVNVATLLSRGHAPGPPAAFVWRSSELRRIVSSSPPAVWPRYAEDYEFVVRGALLGKIVTHDITSCLYRWTGGKSSLSPLKSIQDAERIRVHYAKQVGIEIQPRTAAQIRSMVFMRRASAHTSAKVPLRRVGLVALAIAADPIGVGRRVLKRAVPSNASIESARADTVTLGDTRAAVVADFRANPRDPKAQLVMFSFRIAQAAMGDLEKPRLVSIPFVIFHRLFTEFFLGIELRPKTRVGTGFTIYHGTGLVVNDHARIGRNVTVRNGVTIGHQVAGGGSPLIRDGVVIGASALVLGEIEIGEGAVIGAGSVVVKSVEAYTSVAGNPAKKIRDLPGRDTEKIGTS